MFEVVDYLELCPDCTIAAVNGDYSGIPEENYEAVKSGIESLPPNTIILSGEGGEVGFRHTPCDCCGGPAGNRYLFAVLEEKKKENPFDAPISGSTHKVWEAHREIIEPALKYYVEQGGNIWVIGGDERMFDQFATPEDVNAFIKMSEKHPKAYEIIEKEMRGET